MTTYGTFVRPIDNGKTMSYENYTMYGRPGSSLLDEFNRLANGGEYPTYDKYLDLNGAVNKWVSVPAGTDLIHALNYAAGIGENPKDFKEFTAVLNYLLEAIKEGAEGGGDLNGPETSPRNYLEPVTVLRLIAS